MMATPNTSEAPRRRNADAPDRASLGDVELRSASRARHTTSPPPEAPVESDDDEEAARRPEPRWSEMSELERRFPDPRERAVVRSVVEAEIEALRGQLRAMGYAGPTPEDEVPDEEPELFCAPCRPDDAEPGLSIPVRLLRWAWSWWSSELRSPAARRRRFG